jgi:hypothetical protein
LERELYLNLVTSKPFPRPVGRPTKYSAELVETLCGALADGMPIKGACIVAGISATTLGEWREKYPELETRLTEAREFARQKALQAIKNAGERDWRAHAEWLKLSYPSDYRGGNTRIDVSANAFASSAVVCSEEQRQALMERRKKLMEERPRGSGPIEQRNAEP